MTTYRVGLKIDALNASTEVAFRKTAFNLGIQFTRVITSPRNWAGFGNRDIVDTGQLRSSQQLVFTKPLEAIYSWPVEYAVPVHEGYTLRNGRFVQGRPWTRTAIEEWNPDEDFARNLRENLSNL